MLDKINGISNVNVGNPLQFDSFSNTYNTAFSVDSSGKSGGSASPSGKLEEVMPLLIKLVEQLMEMSQSGSVEDSASSGEGEGGDGVVPSAEDSDSAGHSSSDSGENNTAAGTPVEGGIKSEQSNAESGGDASPSSQLEEIMPLLMKLVEQLMAMLQGDSASGEGKAGKGVASPGEESHSAGSSPSDSAEDNTAGPPVEGGIKPEQSNAESGGDASPSSQLEEIMPLLMKIIEQLVAILQGDSTGDSASSGGSSGEESHSAGNSSGSNSAAVTPAEGGIRSENSNTDSSHIPVPTEHLQSFDLGGKSVTVGGDGTASAVEVQSTADSMKNLYQNSDTFRNMIDSSTDSGFEVSVGKRDDNTSWGNSEGRVFMNINNVEPGNDDTFQSLLGHEFAHASIDIGHGRQMEQLESAIAAEA